MDATPLKVVPFANSVKKEPELINLELGMHKVKPLLTSVQLHELHLQTVIYNHIAAGVAVPGHLVHYVWQKLASSCGCGVLNRLFPSFAGFSSQGFESRSIIDSEPGRCRRTDGKKWRCGRSVLPNQKYCERHMHRGCQRSRKLVEASKGVPPPKKTPSKPNINSETSDAGLSVSSPVSRPLMTTPSINAHENYHSSTTNIWSADETDRRANVSQITPTTISTTENVAECRTPITTSTHSVCVPKKYEYPDRKHEVQNRLGDRSMFTASNIRRNEKIGGSAPLGFGFSPKSVLQDCDGSRIYQQSITESKPERCRRTDGKKWRCSREVLPNQKYCGRHMHRGAKKHCVDSQLDPSSSQLPPTMTVPKKEDTPSSVGLPKRLESPRLSTNLCISTPANAQVVMYSEHTEDTSSSSDATISDNILSYRAQEVSSRTRCSP